jgi:hypothetical protein
MGSMSLTAPILLCMIGLLLSWEYRGGQYHTILWVFRLLSVAAALVGAVGFLIDYPNWAVLAASVAAIVVNLPLAAICLKKK